MTKFITYTLSIILMMVSSLNIFGQPIVRVGHYSGCSNTEILIPVEIENFEDIAALTLFIGVDTASVEYINIENVNNVFSSGEFVGGINLNNQFISLNWSSFTAATLETGIMCNIRVLLKTDAVNFNFQNNCEIVRSNLTIINNVEYVDGSLVTLNSFTPDPISQSVAEGSLATIELLNLTDNTYCQWQKNENENWINIDEEPPYVGVQTNILSIQPVSTEMNGEIYRCLLSVDICSEGSQVSELFVIPNDVNEFYEQHSNPVSIYPNPVDNYLNYVFNANIQSAEVKLINMNGEILKHQQLGDVVTGNNLSFDMTDVVSGNYLFQLLTKKHVISNLKILRK